MDKTKFFKILKKSLKNIPKEERENAIAFYEEYFQDAQDEAQAIASLPHPKKIAAKIIVEVGETQSKVSVATIILAICSAPITLPIAIGMLCMMFSLAIAFIFLMLTPYIVLISLLFVAIAAILFIVPAFMFNVPTGLIFLGIVLCTFSVSILGFMLVNFLWKKIFQLFRTIFLKLGKRSCKNEA